MRVVFFKKSYSDGTTEFYVELTNGKRVAKFSLEQGYLTEVEANLPTEIKMLEPGRGYIVFKYEDLEYNISTELFKDLSTFMQL
jgi:hypothetical protein